MGSYLRRAFAPMREPEGLALPLDLEVGRSLPFYRGLLVFFSVFVAVALVIGSVAPVRELAIAEGQILPKGAIQPVQHFEGGIIEEVLAKSGDIVEAGAPLLRLREAATSSELEQLRVRRANFDFQRDRLNALIDGNEPDFGDVAGDHRELADEQRKLFESERAAFGKERGSYLARVEQRQADYKGRVGELDGLQAQRDIFAEQISMREKLMKQGYGSRHAYLDAKAKLFDTESRIAQSETAVVSAREALVEAQSQLGQFEAQKASDWNTELSRVMGEIAELDQAVAKHEDRFERLYVRAPSHGILLDMLPKARGEVIGPGDVVAKLVPLDEEMMAEVRIDPKDIGHIRAGNEAEVKVTAFDAESYGVLRGKVWQISATTFETEKGEPYYRAEIALDRTALTRGGLDFPLVPGMVVNAEIVTGAKSLMRYLLKPVYRSLDVAFTER